MTGPGGRSNDDSRRWLLALPPLAGLVAVLAATGKGLYVSPDAVFFVGTARNLVDGRGFTPRAGLPPLGNDPEGAAQGFKLAIVRRRQHRHLAGKHIGREKDQRVRIQHQGCSTAHGLT